jgi:hypothetical protein
MCFYNYSNSSKNSETFHYKQHLTDKKCIDDNSSQLLIEENSNETENDNSFDFQPSLLVFLISCVSFDNIQLPISSVAPLTEKLTNPIYLSVCNFRI